MKTAFRLFVCLFLLLSLHSPALSGKTLPASPQHFRLNIGTEPPTLDWSLATDNVSVDVIFNIMEGLTQFDKDLRPIPALAESWEVSPDGTVYRFYLRKGVKWSDGIALRARDFEYSWKRLLNPETAAQYAYFLFDVLNAEAYNSGKISEPAKVGVKALDDHTLEVRLRHPAVYFLSVTTFIVTFPQRKDLVEKHGDSWTAPGTLVTLGPFSLHRWNHEQEIILKKNTSYYGTPPKLDTVQMVMVNEASTGLAMYEQGALDFADDRSLPAIDIPRWKGHPEYREVPQLRGYYYGFNINKEPFNDLRVRKALSMAVDRKVFPKILRGGHLPTASWIPRGMMGYHSDIGLAFDPEKASALFTEAGYPGGKGFPRIKAVYNTSEDNKLVAETLQAMWKANLNIDVELQNMEWKVFLSLLETEPPALYRLGWGADYPDPHNFLDLFTSTSGNNHTGWRSSEYDRLVKEAASEKDPDRRDQLYRKAEKILVEEDVPIMPLFTTTQSYLVKPSVRGLELNAMDLLSLKTVWIEE